MSKKSPPFFSTLNDIACPSSRLAISLRLRIPFPAFLRILFVFLILFSKVVCHIVACVSTKKLREECLSHFLYPGFLKGLRHFTEPHCPFMIGPHFHGGWQSGAVLVLLFEADLGRIDVFGWTDRSLRSSLPDFFNWKLELNGEVCPDPIHFAFLGRPTFKYPSKAGPLYHRFHQGIRYQDTVHSMVCGN